MSDLWKPTELVPLYNEAGDQVAHLTGHISVKDLKEGDRVWDDRNDMPATFDGWSDSQNCYLLFWTEGDYFCGFDLDPNGRPATWRRIVDGPISR